MISNYKIRHSIRKQTDRCGWKQGKDEGEKYWDAAPAPHIDKVRNHIRAILPLKKWQDGLRREEAEREINARGIHHCSRWMPQT